MIEDNRSADRRPRAGQVRPRSDNGRARPPGPEEKRGATATSGKRPEDQQDMRTTMRSPRFWVMLLVLLAINWLLMPFLFPEPQDRVTVPYTFFKQQVAASNVTEITSRGEDIQGEFKQPVADPTRPRSRLRQLRRQGRHRRPTPSSRRSGPPLRTLSCCRCWSATMW